MAFRHPLRVAFDDVDAARIVYFARVFDYCHHAWEAFLDSIGMPLPAILEGGWGAPIVHAEADYRQPLRHGDRFEVEVRVLRLGASSLEMGFTLLGAPPSDGGVRATARIVHAAVDTRARPFAKIPLPERFRAALEATLGTALEADRPG